jgi:signal transduction histidine kinase/DNA-binding response OmpR family regulator
MRADHPGEQRRAGARRTDDEDDVVHGGPFYPEEGWESTDPAARHMRCELLRVGSLLAEPSSALHNPPPGSEKALVSRLENVGARDSASERARPHRDERTLRVLLVDAGRDPEPLIEALRQAGYTPTWERVENAAGMRRALEGEGIQLVIAGDELPDFDAAAALALMRQRGDDIPFLIVAERISEDCAVAAMRAGAGDCLLDDELAGLGAVVDRELAAARERRRRRRAEQARREEAEQAAALARVSRELIGALDTPVLLERLCQATGEVLGCDTSVTLLAQPEEDAFVALAGYGLTREEQEVARVIKVPRHMMRLLLERLEKEDVAEVHTIPREALGAEAPLRSVLCTALRRGREIIGIQVATRRLEGGAFGDTQKRIATAISQMASLALDHARVVEELERASRIKSEFVATVSHELRTPLNVVMGYTDLLIDGTFGDLNAEQLDVLRRIGDRARGLLELINATLDLSRLEAGRVTVDLWPVDLEELIGRVRYELSDFETKPGVALIWEVAPGLAQPSTDEAKLKVVLKNLITNALKFTDRGSVTVGVKSAGQGIELSVVDTGIGIAPEQLSVVFEAFRQGDSSSTRRYGGVGLGLYIVRRLVVLLGGTIEVESEPGRGSSFRVWIPLTPAHD